VINRTILFGNETFVANDRVTSNLDWRQFALTYTYSLFRNDHVEAGSGCRSALPGGGCTRRGECQAASPGSVRVGRVSHDPAGYHLAHLAGLALSARGQYFHASVNNFDGSIAEYHGDLQWRWQRYPNFSLGAGYTIMRSSLDIDDTNFPGSFRLNVRGRKGSSKSASRRFQPTRPTPRSGWTCLRQAPNALTNLAGEVIASSNSSKYSARA